MKALWIFLILLVFCIYVLLGLYITEGLDSIIEIVLNWIIYTILWLTFLNVFTLGYFWSVVRTKQGPTGLRGASGERGKIGDIGKCNIDNVPAYCLKSLNEYIDALYFAKTSKHILNEETQTFPCKYLNNKLRIMSSSKQYSVIVANLAIEKKPIMNIINYLKSIWQKWFELLYNSTEEDGVWFNDEYADEDYTWAQNKNPFDEIRKYDVYYWGKTRTFRPLKAEICRSTAVYESSKLPIPVAPKNARLKIIQSNDYYKVGDSNSDDHNDWASWWSPKVVSYGTDTYYPVGDVMTRDSFNHTKTGKVITGDLQYDSSGDTGPDIKTILVSGDVLDPISYVSSGDGDTRSNDGVRIQTPKCPEGYESLADIAVSNYNGQNQFKCIPSECVETVAPADNPQGSTRVWEKRHKWWRWQSAAWRYTTDFFVNALNSWGSGNKEATPENAYNLMRTNQSSGPFRKIKASCLAPVEIPPSTKEVEPENADLGIGWNGHPYKLEPQYSIFSFLDLVPEGIIVNKGNGRRFYIIHYGGEESNIYLVLDYNVNTGKYDNAIQVSSKPKNNSTSSQTISKLDVRQQWKIILQSNDKTQLTLKSLSNNNYLYVSMEPIEGNTKISTIDLDKKTYKKIAIFNKLTDNQLDNCTKFSFISSFGPQLNIIDK